MPNLNRKGPNGEGAMTGRKMGKCSPENKGKSDEEIFQARTLSSIPVRGLGCGRGRRLGFNKGQGQGKGLGQRFNK